MQPNSNCEEALTQNIKHPSHSDPMRVGGFLGLVVFFAVMIGVFFVFPNVSLVVALGFAGFVSILVGLAFSKVVGHYVMKKEAAIYAEMREEQQRQTEKAILEMKVREAEEAGK